MYNDPSGPWYCDGSFYTVDCVGGCLWGYKILICNSWYLCSPQRNILPVRRLSSRDSHFKLWSMAVVEAWLVRGLLKTALADLLCTTSTLLASVLVMESHAVEAYSRIGLTNCLYALARGLVEWGGIVHLRKPRVIEAFAVMCSGCEFHLRSSWTFTSRYLIVNRFYLRNGLSM